MADTEEWLKKRVQVRALPDLAPLRKLLEEAAGRGGAAAARAGKNVKVSLEGTAHSVQLVFSGPGAAAARKAAQQYVDAQLPSAAAELRSSLIRAMEH